MVWRLRPVNFAQRDPSGPELALAVSERQSLNDKVLGSLREAILSGDFKPGDRLVEGRLAERFGVSRNPVREALKALGNEGLITIRAGRGAVVTELSESEAADVVELRAALEGFSARLAARRLEPVAGEALARVLAKGEKAASLGDLEELHRLNDEFHGQLANAGSNRVLADFMRTLRAKTHWLFASVSRARARGKLARARRHPAGRSRPRRGNGGASREPSRDGGRPGPRSGRADRLLRGGRTGNMRLLTDAEVRSFADPVMAAEAVSDAFSEAARGETALLARQRISAAGLKLSAMSAILPGEGVAGAKVYTTIDGAFRFVVVLFDAASGAPLAVLEADALTEIRTAAVTEVVAARASPGQGGKIAVFGTGVQARAHVRALARRLRPVKVAIVSRGGSGRARGRPVRRDRGRRDAGGPGRRGAWRKGGRYRDPIERAAVRRSPARWRLLSSLRWARRCPTRANSTTRPWAGRHGCWSRIAGRPSPRRVTSDWPWKAVRWIGSGSSISHRTCRAVRSAPPAGRRASVADVKRCSNVRRNRAEGVAVAARIWRRARGSRLDDCLAGSGPTPVRGGRRFARSGVGSSVRDAPRRQLRNRRRNLMGTGVHRVVIFTRGDRDPCAVLDDLADREGGRVRMRRVVLVGFARPGRRRHRAAS